MLALDLLSLTWQGQAYLDGPQESHKCSREGSNDQFQQPQQRRWSISGNEKQCDGRGGMIHDQKKGLPLEKIGASMLILGSGLGVWLLTHINSMNMDELP